MRFPVIDQFPYFSDGENSITIFPGHIEATVPMTSKKLETSLLNLNTHVMVLESIIGARWRSVVFGEFHEIYNNYVTNFIFLLFKKELDNL